MSLKYQMEADMAIFFNTAEFAEEILYDGITVTAIPESVITPQKGNQYADIGYYSDGSFVIRKGEIPSPKLGSEIVYNGKNWAVDRIEEEDELSFKAVCSIVVSVYGGRR